MFGHSFPRVATFQVVAILFNSSQPPLVLPGLTAPRGGFFCSLLASAFCVCLYKPSQYSAPTAEAACLFSLIPPAVPPRIMAA